MERYDFHEFAARCLPEDPVSLPLVKISKALGVSRSGPWIAGGAVRRTLTGRPLDTDLDFFFANSAQLEGMKGILTALHKAELLHENEANTTYKVSIFGTEYKVQLIHFAFYPSIEELLDTFDYTICQFGFDGVDLVVGDFTLWDTGRNRLAVHCIHWPTASLRRMIKYANQGFTVCSGCMQEFLRQAANVTDSDRQIRYID